MTRSTKAAPDITVLPRALWLGRLQLRRLRLWSSLRCLMLMLVLQLLCMVMRTLMLLCGHGLTCMHDCGQTSTCACFERGQSTCGLPAVGGTMAVNGCGAAVADVDV